MSHLQEGHLGGFRGGSRGDGRKHRRDETPLVKLSKSLSYVLRHGAQREGLSIRPDGYVELDELVNDK